jgi:hypothetical protein
VSRERVSFWIAFVGALLIGGVGLSAYLRDGSYFLDAASVVLSFDELGVLESFREPLSGGGQSFPRFYLFLIRGVRWLFGPETWATRLLPHLFFLAATALWMRLFFLRFASRPALVLLGVLLVTMAPTWWVYSAVVKQYSLDVFLSLGLFALPDSVFADALGRRRRLGRLALLVLPVLFSYTYGVVLLARCLGWLAFGWTRGRRGDPLACALLAGGLIVALGLLWFTDLRHTLGREALVNVWQKCVASRQSPGELPELLRRFLASWYVGPLEFGIRSELPAPVLWVLIGAQGLGIVRVVRSIFVRGSPGLEERWGSRSLGSVAALAGALGTSFLLDYPICAGRSTLFLLCLQQILMLEGISWLASGVRHAALAPALRRILEGAGLLVLTLLLAVCAVTGIESAGLVLERLPLEDVRPLLQRVRDEPDLPVLVTFCMKRQMHTLPEGLEGLDVRWLPFSRWESLVPKGQEVWIVHSRLTKGPCERIRTRLERMSYGFDVPEIEGETAVIYRAQLLTEPALRDRRLRALQMRIEGEKSSDGQL